MVCHAYSISIYGFGQITIWNVKTRFHCWANKIHNDVKIAKVLIIIMLLISKHVLIQRKLFSAISNKKKANLCICCYFPSLHGLSKDICIKHEPISKAKRMHIGNLPNIQSESTILHRHAAQQRLTAHTHIQIMENSW